MTTQQSLHIEVVSPVVSGEATTPAIGTPGATTSGAVLNNRDISVIDIGTKLERLTETDMDGVKAVVVRWSHNGCLFPPATPTIALCVLRSQRRILLISDTVDLNQMLVICRMSVRDT